MEPAISFIIASELQALETFLGHGEMVSVVILSSAVHDTYIVHV